MTTRTVNHRRSWTLAGLGSLALIAGGLTWKAMDAGTDGVREPAKQAQVIEATATAPARSPAPLVTVPRQRLAGTPAAASQPLESTTQPVAATGTIGGVVDHDDGTPAPRTVVVALDNESGERARTLTAFDGSFQLPPLAPGEYTVWAARPADVRLRATPDVDDAVQVTVVADEVTAIALAAPPATGAAPVPAPEIPGELRGRVVAAGDGSPLAGVAVSLRPAPGAVWQTARTFDLETDDSGYFTFVGLPAGPVWLTVATGQPVEAQAKRRGRIVTAEVEAGRITDVEAIAL